jgi:hypothetical protein
MIWPRTQGLRLRFPTEQRWRRAAKRPAMAGFFTFSSHLEDVTGSPGILLRGLG